MWTRANIERSFRAVWPDKEEFSFWCMFHRICIAGSAVSPPLFEMMEALGREECVKRVLLTVRAL